MTQLLDSVDLNLVENFDDFCEFRRWLGESRNVLAIDVETTGFRWQDLDHVRLVQFGDTRSGWAIPAQDWIGPIREVLEQYAEPIVGHNIRFDLHFLEKLTGYRPKWKNVNDTMIMAALLDPPGRKALKILGDRHVDPRASQGEKALHDAMHKGGWGWHDVPIMLPAYWQYGILDTVIDAHLHDKIEPMMHSADLMDAYELESNTARVLYEMESHGFALDRPYVDELEAKLTHFLDEAVPWVRENYGISATSTHQLAKALAEQGVPLTKRTEKGNLVMDEEVLTPLSKMYPLAGIALEIRQAKKLVSSYLANFRKFCSPDGMVHARINQMQARTHRMSITDPALQTLGRGKLVRNAFMARPGYKLVTGDFSQVEARLFAVLANEPAMIAAIQRGENLHFFCARTALGRDPTEQELQVFKNVTFCTLYGGGVAKIAYTAGIPLEDADIFSRAYHSAFPGVKRWQKEVEAIGRQRYESEGIGYIRTSDGSILSLGDDDDRFYALTNFSIQGEAAVLFKRRLISAANAGLLPYMVLPVHDELILEVPEADAEEARVTLKESMEDLYTYPVPIDVKVGKLVDRWGEAK